MKNLIGYEVVYYHKGNRLYAGNKQRFPVKEAAVNYKNYYESHKLGENLIIENVEYEGEPISMKHSSDNSFKATYATFKRIAGGIWEYCGECFAGENVAA